MTNTVVTIKLDFGIGTINSSIFVMDNPHISVASFDARDISVIALTDDGEGVTEIVIQMRGAPGKFFLRYDGFGKPEHEIQEMKDKMLGAVGAINAFTAMLRPDLNPLEPQSGLTYLVKHQA